MLSFWIYVIFYIKTLKHRFIENPVHMLPAAPDPFGLFSCLWGLGVCQDQPGGILLVQGDWGHPREQPGGNLETLVLGGQWDHEAKGKVLGLLVRTPARCATAREEVMLPEQLQILWRVTFVFYPVESLPSGTTQAPSGAWMLLHSLELMW